MSAATLSNGAWPNLFVVGGARCGTTSLWRHLDAHPEIWMAPVKEPNFFSGVRHRLSPFFGDEESYLQLFAPGAAYRLRGEASVSYLWHPDAPAAIQRVSPQARILISLRDPVDRAHSSYWHAVRLGNEHRPMKEAILAELEGRSQERSRYVLPSLYADPVDRYGRLFPGGVHVLFFEELVRDLRREMRRIFEFLGVDSGVIDRLDDAAQNAFGLPKNPVARTVLRSPRLRAAARFVVPLPFRARVEELLLKRPPKPVIEPDVEELLTAHFAPDVERLREMLGRVPWARYSTDGAGE